MIDDRSLPIPPAAPTPQAEKPFVIVLERLEETPSGSFRPGAFVKLTPALCHSGLLAALPAEDLKTLLALFTLLSPNGAILPTALEIADAMRISEGEVMARLERLMWFVWQEKPLVIRIRRETSPDAYTLTPDLITGYEQQTAAPRVVLQAAGREAVIAHSREQYAHPRAEVEREIAEQMGWQEPEGEQERSVYNRLLNLGIAKEEAASILERFPLGVIQQQLDWLPYRHAKSPARFLVAAIEGNYEAPHIVHQSERAADVDDQEEPPTDAGVPENKSEGPLAKP